MTNNKKGEEDIDSHRLFQMYDKLNSGFLSDKNVYVQPLILSRMIRRLAKWGIGKQWNPGLLDGVIVIVLHHLDAGSLCNMVQEIRHPNSTFQVVESNDYMYQSILSQSVDPQSIVFQCPTKCPLPTNESCVSKKYQIWEFTVSLVHAQSALFCPIDRNPE